MNTQAFTAPHRKRIKRLARQLRAKFRTADPYSPAIYRTQHRLEHALAAARDEITRDRAREARQAIRYGRTTGEGIVLE